MFYFRAGRDGTTGKWRQVAKKGFASKKEAEEALCKAIAEHEKNPLGRDPRTFSEFFGTWIREHCERNCEATTTEGYMKKGAYATRHFGDELLVKLHPLQIETALNALSDHGGKNGRPLSPKTVREVAAVVNATFNAAIRWDVVDVNPMARVTLPRMEKREPKVLEKFQLEWFLSGVDGHEWLHVLVLLDASTGCRRGELLAAHLARHRHGNRGSFYHQVSCTDESQRCFLEAAPGKEGPTVLVTTFSYRGVEKAQAIAGQEPRLIRRRLPFRSEPRVCRSLWRIFEA